MSQKVKDDAKTWRAMVVVFGEPKIDLEQSCGWKDRALLASNQRAYLVWQK